MLSMRSRNPDLTSVIERRIDEFALGEVPEERTALERLVDEHDRGNNHGNLLWALLVLELWLRLSVEQTLSASDTF